MQFIVELKREKNLLTLDFDINSNIRRLNNIVQNIIIDLASCIAGYEKLAFAASPLKNTILKNKSRLFGWE
jgi:hypothetical protein